MLSDQPAFLAAISNRRRRANLREFARLRSRMRAVHFKKASAEMGIRCDSQPHAPPSTAQHGYFTCQCCVTSAAPGVGSSPFLLSSKITTPLCSCTRQTGPDQLLLTFKTSETFTDSHVLKGCYGHGTF
ncbi:hypothetical protein EYF80_061839 [Liparis tanakae]|uniref:Uncharacterized protein n=1 Tax=Liparis tanakae TaxID=230148 RepID=A0A4Z2EGW2_9TELE|nr:hypothetical protein EYF80_061839 [Liparis tanakae]